MRILGIDPGVARTGYGLIEKTEKNEIIYLKAGCFSTQATLPFPLRLQKLYQQISALIRKFKPDVVGMEKLFFVQNVKTALSVGQAQGVIILAAGKAKLEVKEYTPRQIKQAVTGFGQADKKQVQKMVQRLLKLKELPQPDDTADALATAICCLHSLGL